MRNRNTIVGVLFFVLCGTITVGAQEALQRALDQTIDNAAQEAGKRLKATAFEDIQSIAVLPLWGACPNDTKTYIVRTIQSQLIGGPYRVMERSDPAWDNLLSEIEWSDKREDIMNQATLQQFGRIVGCDAVVYGTVRECQIYPDSFQAVTRLSLTMGVVETGEAKWSSGEIKEVKVVPGPLELTGNVDSLLAQAISQACQKAASSLQASGAGTEGFVVFPLRGQDGDGYVRGVLQSSLAQVGSSPIPVAIAEWREYLVANSQNEQSVEAMRGFAKLKGYPALLHGAVNVREARSGRYHARASFTVTLVETETGRTLWSPGEVTGHARLSGRDLLIVALRDPIVWVVGGLLIAFIIWRAFRKMFISAMRPR
jgi:hypothetical protein